MSDTVLGSISTKENNRVLTPEDLTGSLGNSHVNRYINVVNAIIELGTSCYHNEVEVE